MQNKRPSIDLRLRHPRRKRNAQAMVDETRLDSDLTLLRDPVERSLGEHVTVGRDLEKSLGANSIGWR